ncbi:MAG: diaminopimelate epimerase [Tepidisphaeraceae bacterium]|jgi:diaminopimelate epimerase
MKFTKMQGIGNDYVYVNGFTETVADPARLAKQISDRHFGVGSDGLILILPSKLADVRMRMFNADGGESEMCGNGIRCVAKYAFEHGIARRNPMKVETGRGVLNLELQLEGADVRSVTVNMGQPILELAKIPVESRFLRASSKSNEFSFSIEGSNISHAAFVSMGNPHAVIFVDDVNEIDVARLGPLVERHEAFPRRINVHWVQVKSRGEVIVRTWERGSGITLACGTGACAVCVAGEITGRTDRKILAHLPGGDLTLDWRQKDNCVYMTGPAVEVFSGEWNND